MGYIAIQNSNLTEQELLSIFERGFSGRYDVYASRLPAVDLIIKKSCLAGVAVRLQNKRGGPRLRCAPITPSFLLRLVLFNGMIPALLMWSKLRKLTNEIGAFVASSAELQGGHAVPAGETPVERHRQPGERQRNHVVTAAWVGTTALLAPSVANLIYFGHFGLALSVPLFLMAGLAAGAGFALSKMVGGTGSARAIVVALGGWMVARLVASPFFWGIAQEVELWLNPYGLIQLALIAASGAVLARISRPKPAATGSVMVLSGYSSGAGGTVWRVSR